MIKYIVTVIVSFSLMWSYSFAADNYTVATATAQVRALLNENSTNYITDTEFENWVKEAAEDISTRIGCFQISDTIALVTDQYEYATTVGTVSIADIIEVLGAVYVATTDIIGDTNQDFIGLTRVPASYVAEIPLIEAGPPRYYYHAGNKIGFLPVPTATENTKVVRIYFTQQSQTIGDLPNEYQSLTFWYIAAMAYKRMANYSESEKMYGMYLEKLATIKKVEITPKEVQK